MDEKIEKMIQMYKERYLRNLETINDFKLKLEEARISNNTRHIEYYERRINDLMQQLKYNKARVDFMRPVNEQDTRERRKIISDLPTIVKNIIPDDVPMVFHGVNDISVVLEIIKSGGLFTPEERGVGNKSFATQIDVTYKNNISVTCEFAEPDINTFMPYGAIFVFMPLEEEKAKVLATGESTEVQNGVSSVNFRLQPERLVSIITTSENLDLLKKHCQENDIDFNKVYTADGFVSKCRQVFPQSIPNNYYGRTI